VTALPARLAPWAAQLAALPPDLALAVLPWLGPLALALGPMSGDRTTRADEPDGYAGLARRGPYDRLIVSEWGIAELYPEEFVRRATAGEHLFVELARRAPSGERRCVAVVSAGPDQLGAPRLAQLAALIALARRAAAAGARFAWGVLEDPERAVSEALEPEAIRRMLALRTARAADPTAFPAWRAPWPGAERWFVGGDRDAAAARAAGHACVLVRDVVDPAVRALDVEVDRGTARPRVRLALPSERDTARLIRDPFTASRGPRSAGATGGATELVFSPDGRRLVVRTSDHQLESWPIPGSPHEPLGALRRWRPPAEAQIAAIGMGARAAIAVLVDPARPGVVELGNGAGHRLEVALAPPLQDRVQAWGAQPSRTGALGLIAHRRRGTDLVLELGGALAVIAGGFTGWPDRGTRLSAQPLSERRDTELLGYALRPQCAVWAEAIGESVELRVSSSAGNRTISTWPRAMESRIWFGPFDPGGARGWGAVALAIGPGRWVFAADGKRERPELHASQPVLGAALLGPHPTLLVREDDRRLAWTAAALPRLPAEPSGIVEVRLCPHLAKLAWTTGDGDAVVYSVEHQAVVLRRKRGEP
jgi:hypothetical protein